jgi:hypothetical protein
MSEHMYDSSLCWGNEYIPPTVTKPFSIPTQEPLGLLYLVRHCGLALPAAILEGSVQNKEGDQDLYNFPRFFRKKKQQTGKTEKHELGGERASPHDWAAVTSFVGARVAATWRRRGVTGVDVNRAQLIPTQHGQQVFFPWGGRAAARLVQCSSITPSMGTSTGRRAWQMLRVLVARDVLVLPKASYYWRNWNPKVEDSNLITKANFPHKQPCPYPSDIVSPCSISTSNLSLAYYSDQIVSDHKLILD